MVKNLLTLAFLVSIAWPALSQFAQETKPVLKIYGTEGPGPAIKEAAEAFASANSVKVEVTATPIEKWKSQALKDADVIYSSSENVMDSYNDTLGIIDDKSITTFFLRPAALLVRRGNPKKIKGIKDFLHRDLKVIIVNGQGQVAMWEDIVGRLKDTAALNDFRKRIAFVARTTTEALQYWKNHEEVEAWLIFPTWAQNEEVQADVVHIEKDLVIYRSMGAAVTTVTHQRELALKFLEYLKSAEAEKIFKSKGWFKKEK